MYSPSVTSFASADMAVRQQPHQKMYKLRTGCVNVSHSHKLGNREHTKATAQETCDSWRKRGNEAYKSGDLSEAEVCYSKGISSIQHTETPGVCIQPLIFCYSNRATIRMELTEIHSISSSQPNMIMECNDLFHYCYGFYLFMYALTRFVCRPMLEITFSTIDIPKLLSQEIRSKELHNDVS
ncbi:hypothetical protein Lser_V15G28742 [Lactuca serriola]